MCVSWMCINIGKQWDKMKSRLRFFLNFLMNAIDGEKEDVLKVQTVIAFIVIKSCCVYGAGF